MIRCFIALELDDAAHHDLRDAANALDTTGWRVTSPDKYHVTLKFLGDVDPDDLHAVTSATGKACAAVAPFALRGAEIGMIPNPRRPRILAAMFDPAPPVVELVEQLEVLLADEGFAMEQRAYHPHVTLARKSHSQRSRPSTHLDPPPIDHVTIKADHVALIQSILTDEAPIYQVLKRFPLKAKP